MARTKDIKVDNKRILVRITPDWERLNYLASKVDNGDYSALDELVDLAVYERETELFARYIDMASERGNIKAQCVQAEKLNDWDIKKLLTYRKGYRQGAVTEHEYQQVRNAFALLSGLCGFVIVAIFTMCKMVYN